MWATLLSLYLAGAALADSQQQSETAAAKQAAFETLGQRQQAALNDAMTARRRLSVYINSDVDDFSLGRVEIEVDGRRRASRRYSELEQGAFQADGFHRSVRVAVAPGRHRLLVRAQGLRVGENGEAAYEGIVESGFDMPPGPHSLVVPVSALQPANRGWYVIRPYGWRVKGPDPAVRMARFLRHAGDPYAAMIELFGLAAERGPEAVAGPGARIELAFGYVAFGMPDRAREQLDALAAGDPFLDRIPDLRIALARLYLARGDANTALAVLGGSPEQPVRRLFWIDLKSRALIARGRHRQAADLLDGADRLAESVDRDGFRHYARVFRFNRAVALIRDEAADAGRRLMERLGRQTGTDPGSAMLRDRANLTLGFHLLRDAAGQAADRVLQRVSGDGVEASQAGLARGWAALAVGRADEAGMAALKAASPADLERALRFWSDVAAGPIERAPVQEALVMTAFAHHQLGHADRAPKAFRRALDTLEGRLRQLGDRMAEVRRQATDGVACSEPAWRGDENPALASDTQDLASAARDYRQLCGLYALLAGPRSRLLSAPCGRAGLNGQRPAVPVDLKPWSVCNGIEDFWRDAPGVGRLAAGARSVSAAVDAQRQYLATTRLRMLAGERNRTDRYLEMAVDGMLAHYERSRR